MKNFINLSCDYNLYSTFYAVAKFKSFSIAAKELFVSQPNISYCIKKLETQLGTKLLIRSNKTLTLTNDGENLFKLVEQAHNLLVTAEKSLSEINNLHGGELNIGAPSHIASFLLVDIIKQYNKSYPNVKINIINKSTKEMIYMLEDNLLDLIVDSFPLNIKSDKIHQKTIGEFDTCLACNPLYVNFDKDICQQTFILPNNYTSTRKIVDLFFEENNLKINCMFEASTTDCIYSLVQKGLGIGYFVKQSITSQLKNKELIVFELKKSLPKIEIGYVVNNKYINNATKKFIKIMEN